MRAILAAIFISVFVSGPLAAQDQKIEAIENVISSQLDAFLKDDFATAFTFASPNIRSLFGSPDRFGMMVRQGYPMVWRPADVQYVGVEDGPGFKMQKVLITDQNGARHLLGYAMIQTPDGWQINGVQILRAPEVGA